MNRLELMDDRLAERFWSKVDRRGPDECWPWTASTTNGYGQFAIRRTLQAVAPRVAFYLATGHVPTLNVLHSCDNRACCNPAHLREGTQADNMRDLTERGRSTSRLTHRDAYEIRRRFYEGEGRAALLAEYGISEGVFTRLVRGRTFPTVPMFPYRDGRAGRKAPSRREVLARKYPDGPPYWGRKVA